jgi:nucleoside-diphosphate-sugar epimerase
LPDLQATSKAIFITGATGFIGQRLVSTLLRQGEQVRALVRPEKYPDQRIPEGCEQISGGLTDATDLAHVIAESRAIIYCAGSVRGRSGVDFAAANIIGIKSLLAVLGDSERPPPVLLLSSLAASRPHLSDYAYSKSEGEKLLRQQQGIPWTILRPPAVYGPGDREMLPVLKMIRRGMIVHAGPRDQRLSLLHVDDLVNAIVTWLSAPQACLHKTYAIDDGTPGGYDWKAIGHAVSNKEVPVLRLPDTLLQASAKMNLLLSRLLGYSPMLSPGKVRELAQADWLCDNSAFSDATGWKPRLDLKQGVEQLFQPEHGSLPT